MRKILISLIHSGQFDVSDLWQNPKIPRNASYREKAPFLHHFCIILHNFDAYRLNNWSFDLKIQNQIIVIAFFHLQKKMIFVRINSLCLVYLMLGTLKFLGFLGILGFCHKSDISNWSLCINEMNVFRENYFIEKSM